jgi:putative cell wall-binding protein
VAVGLAAVLVPSAAQAATNTAVDDAYIVNHNVTLSVEASGGLLANDDVDSPVVISLVSNPTHGNIDLITNEGAFTYAQFTDFAGDDAFTYCIKTDIAHPCVSANATVKLHVQGTIDRIGGADRYVVSAGISAKQFPPMTTTVYVASGENFPDALSASAVAGTYGSPVLLVGKDSVPSVIATELTRLKPQNIILMGGVNSVSSAVETRLHDFIGMGGSVLRISGATRFDVSAKISSMAFGSDRPVVYVASGEGFPDALSGSAAAGKLGGPVLLVQKNAIPDAISAELARLAPAKVVVLGGANAVSDSVVATLSKKYATSRVSGADRFRTSALVSGVFLPADTHTIFVASGETFPDALSGAASAIVNHAPVLLVAKNSISTDVATELDRLNPTRIVLLGGTAAVSDAVYARLQTFV